MAKRTKKNIITGVSREQADEAFALYAKADASIAKLTADVELQCARIREKSADRLALLTAERDLAFDTLQAYATENKDSLFLKKKSLDFAHGVIGFRTGTPKLRTLRGFTWASVLQLVRRFLPDYIRLTEEVAKDRLLADRNLQEVLTADNPSPRPMTDVLASCGLQVVQDETFFVEPKREEQP